MVRGHLPKTLYRHRKRSKRVQCSHGSPSSPAQGTVSSEGRGTKARPSWGIWALRSSLCSKPSLLAKTLGPETVAQVSQFVVVVYGRPFGSSQGSQTMRPLSRALWEISFHSLPFSLPAKLGEDVCKGTQYSVSFSTMPYTLTTLSQTYLWPWELGAYVVHG